MTGRRDQGIPDEEVERIWRVILVDWLKWSDERASTWISLFRTESGEMHHWVYHGSVLGQVVPLLITDDAWAKIDEDDDRDAYPGIVDEVLESIQETFEPGIDGKSVWDKDFPFSAAKERVMKLLRPYQDGFPEPSVVSEHERVRRCRGPVEDEMNKKMEWLRKYRT